MNTRDNNYKDGKETVNVNTLDTYTQNVARGATAWIKRTEHGYFGVDSEDNTTVTWCYETDKECANVLQYRLGYRILNNKTK